MVKPTPPALWRTVLFGLLQLFSMTVSANDVGLPPGEKPLKLMSALYLSDVDGIRSAQQNFDARVFYELSWHDPRLAHNEEGPITKPLNEIWHPRIHVLNQQKFFSSGSEQVKIMPDGHVVNAGALWGTFSQRMLLKTFPFDTQK